MDSFSSLSNSLSRRSVLENDEAAASPAGGPGWRENDAISNEQIRNGDLILGAYRVASDPILGGMGSVWRVRHQEWKADLAMKRPQPRFFAEGGDRKKEQFVHECEYWINLGLHPNIVSCYYVREIGGVPTIFSEWMENGDLASRIRDGMLYGGSEGEVQKRLLDIAVQCARGLDYAHHNGLIHQDIKPANLLVTHNGGNLKLIDFGLSDTDAHYLNKGAAGTLQYVAPEVLAGQGADARSDLYSLGCILWESGHYRRIARRCMAADPSRRYATAGEVAAALRRSPAGWLLPLAAAALLAGLFLLYRERRVESAADRIFTRATELMEEAGGVRAAEEP